MNGWIIVGTKVDTKQLEKDLKNLEKEYAQYGKEYEKLLNERAEVEIKVKDYEDTKAKLEDLQNEFDNLKAKAEKINVETPTGMGEYKAIQEQMGNVWNSAGEYELKLQREAEEYEKQKNIINEINGEISETASKQEEVKQKIDQTNAKLNQIKGYQRIKGQIDDMGKALKSLATKGDLKGISKRIENIGKSVSGITKKILRWGLALFGIRTAYNFIRNSINSITDSNEGLANQLQFIKAVVGSALEPLIKRIISLVYTLLSFINSIVMKLTGKNLFAQATKNLQKGASSAKEIKKQLAGFDEMNILSDTSSKGSGSGGFSTQGFEPIDKKFWDFLEKTKKLLEEGDWGKIARIISAGIIKGLDWLSKKIKSINWKGIGKNLSDFLTNIDFSGIYVALVKVFGEALLGFQDMILEVDWPKVFKNFGKGISDALYTANEYLKMIKWSDIGTMLSNTFIAIPWGDIGSNILEAIWTTLSGITELLLSIDWGQVAKSISDAVSQWIETIIKKFQQTDWEQLGKNIVDAIFDFIENVDWIKLGVDILTGLAEGIMGTIKLIIGAFEELVKRILAFFGIHSPSKLFEDIGKNLMLGLLNGISSIINSVVKVFTGLWDKMKSGAKGAWDGIKNTFSGVANFFKTIFTNAWTAVKNVFSTGGKVFTGIKEGILTAFKQVVNVLIDGINKVVSIPFNGLNNVLNKIQNLSFLGISPFSWLGWRAPIPQIPKLARGGIVNNPGPGVMMGSYIAGEKGPEAVIPLDDATLDRLGIAFARHTVINANITNTMNGRVIGRELQKIQNESDFAFNR